MAILIYLTICMLEGIITKPIVQASRESNAPAWMLVPIIGCLSLGAIFLFSISTEFGGGTQAHVWVGALYVIAVSSLIRSARFDERNAHICAPGRRLLRLGDIGVVHK